MRMGSPAHKVVARALPRIAVLGLSFLVPSCYV